MRQFREFIRRNAFKLLVLTSIGVLIYYARGEKILDKLNNFNAQSNQSLESSSTQTPESKTNTVRNEDWLMTKPLPMDAVKKENKTNLPVLNNVKIADVGNNEQIVIIQDNPQQTGADIILVEKGVRAKWIFRFKDSEPCKGKISIEKFEINIPAFEKETVMYFAPLKDFTVTCDKGKFNYYIKIVDNLNEILSASKPQVKTPKKENVSSKTSQSKKAASDRASTKKQITKSDNIAQVKPKENIIEPIPEPSKPKENSNIKSSNSNNLRSIQEPAAVKEDTSKPQEEPKKKGILDHFFHHH